MDENNNSGATSWMIWLAGIVFTCFIATFGFLGNTVRANEDKRVEENTRIREEAKDDVALAVQKLEDKIESESQKLENKIEKLQVEQTVMKVQSAEILTTLKQVYKEVKQ